MLVEILFLYCSASSKEVRKCGVGVTGVSFDIVVLEMFKLSDFEDYALYRFVFHAFSGLPA
jgi:hypothetical protein